MPLGNRPPVSLAAQRTIKDAFNNLQKSLSTTDRRSLQDTTLEEVRQAAKQIENQLAARQSLRNMRRLLPFFDGLSHYSKSIEVLCNGTPYMCWIWAPIKVILKVASDYTEAFERIIQGYSRIAEPLSRFEIIGETYSKNIHVQETLAIFYADILNFHQNAYKLVCRSGWTVLFLSSWGRFQRTFDGIFEDLKYHEALIDKTAAAVNISEAKAMRDTMELWRQEHLERIEKDNLDKALSNYSTVAGWLKFDETDQLRVSESISSEPQRYRGTTDWVTRNGKIASWMRPNHEKAFLMLHGHPGTGKSVLTTEIATFLRSANASLVITHFCTDSYAASTEHTEVLKSILVQLIRSNADLASHAYDELVRQKNSPSSRVLEKLIHDLVIGAAESPSQTRCIHVIVDGLNECTEVQQKEITKTLERIVLAASSKSSGLTICKVLLSTHTTHRLLGEIRNKQTMSLSEEKREVTKSIEQYASQRIARISARLRQIGITESDKQDLVRIIAAKADGMFLWARLVLDYLSTNIFYNREEILRAADSLPRKLSEFYGQIVAQLTAPLAEFSVERVKMTLSWIAFAKRPLKKAELLSALAFSDGNTTVSELPPAYIFEKCGPLVEMRNDSSFAFIHVSVKDFLKSPESNMLLSEDTAYYQHGLSTATCLLSGLKIMAGPFPESDRNLRILRGLHAFHTYATEYWTEYLLAVASSRTGLDMTSPFFSLSHQLAKALGNVPRQYNDSILNFLAASDERLVSLQGYPELHSVVVQSILDRGPKEMEERCEDEQDTINPVANVTSLKSLLLLYQSLIRRLLAMRTVAGIDLEDFERFKIEFRTTAFACRMLSCPRASLGFDSEAQLMEHEASHLGITCNVPECQYPPFSSNRALKMHQSKCHPTRETGVVRRRGIRRTRSKPLSDEYVSHANKSQPISRGEVFMSGDKSWKPLAPPPEHPYVTETWAEVDPEVATYAKSVSTAVKNLNQELLAQGQTITDLAGLDKLIVAGRLHLYPLRTLVEEIPATLLTSSELWSEVQLDLRGSKLFVLPMCWSALTRVVTSRHVALEYLFDFVEQVILSLAPFEEPRLIWRILVQGVRPSILTNVRFWRLLNRNIDTDIDIDIGRGGVTAVEFRDLIGLIPQDQRTQPGLLEAIISGMPELEVDKLELEAMLQSDLSQAQNTIEGENESMLSTQLNDSQALERSMGIRVEDDEILEDADVPMAEAESRTKNYQDDPEIVKVEAILTSYIHDAQGKVSAYILEKRARRLLRTHGLSMSNKEFDAWIRRLRGAQENPVHRPEFTNTTSSVSFATSEGSTLVGSLSRSASSFRPPGFSDQYAGSQGLMRSASTSRSSEEVTANADHWARQWVARWATQQRKTSLSVNDGDALALELKQVPFEIKRVPQFWEQLSKQAMILWKSGDLSVMWIPAFYESIPDQVTVAPQFWNLVLSPFPILTLPIEAVWMVFLNGACVCPRRDLWNPRFWQAIATKTPNSSPGSFGQSIDTAFLVWVSVLNVIYSCTSKDPLEPLWDAFKQGVPAMATKVDDIQRILQQPPEYLQAQVPATIIPGIDLTPANRASGLGDNTLAAVEAYAPEPFDPYKHLSDFLSLLKHADYHFDRSDVGQMLRDFVNQPDYSTHKHSFWVNVMNSIPKPKQEDTKFWNGLFSAIPVSADEMGNDDNFWKAIAGSLPRLTDDSAGWEAWAALIAGLKWNLGGMLLYPSLWARLYDSIDAACECNVRMWTELVSQVPYYTRASIGLKSAVQKAGDWGPGFERVWNQAMIYSHV